MEVCLLVPSASSAGQWMGFPNRLIHPGAGISSLTVGDFNEDGIADLVTVGEYPEDVSVLLGVGTGGVGDGNFELAANYSLENAAYTAEIGDFNCDGVTDVVVGSWSGIYILLGDGAGGLGDGTFRPPVAYDAGLYVDHISMGDINGDGITDLAVMGRYSDNISVLPGDGAGGTGDGTFLTSHLYAVGRVPTGLVVEDFNGDDLGDIVVTIEDTDKVSVLLATAGSESINLQPAVDYLVGDRPRSVATGDFNSDGIKDLVVTNSESHNISVLLGNGSDHVGDGTFRAAINYPSGFYPGWAATGDYNADGIDDIAIGQSSPSIAVHHGNGSGGVGDGTFGAPVILAEGVYGPCVFHDFNSDGKVDLVGNAGWGRGPTILLGNGRSGTGDPSFLGGKDIYLGSAPTALTTGDFNSDGIVDLAAGLLSDDSVEILRGNGANGIGDGSFTLEPRFPACDGPELLKTGDFNEDGITDLVVQCDHGGIVSILLGRGIGGVGDGTFHDTPFIAPTEWCDDLVLGDFNGDDITDLVAADFFGERISVLQGHGGGGVGDGTFQEPVVYDAKDGPVSLAVGDFNGDCIADLVAANGSHDSISQFIGGGSDCGGDGTFQPPVVIEADGWPVEAMADDFNNDGIADLITTNYTRDSLTVYISGKGGEAGNSALGSPTEHTLGFASWELSKGDFNNDGITDIVTTNYESGSIAVLLGGGIQGVGDGSFQDALYFRCGFRPVEVNTGDFNSDGLLDLATANYVDRSVTVLLNLGFSDASDPLSITLGRGEASVGDDRNGDGIVDAADLILPP